MASVQDPTVQRRRLRLELRRARDAAGLKQAEVASAMDWSPSKLIRIESGQVSISTNDLKALLHHYGVRDQGKVNGLLDLAKSARGPSFYDQYSDLLKPGFKEYLAYEASASIIRQYDPVLISGLLQTEEYGRAVLTDSAGFSGADVDRLWEVREHRQAVHERDNPPDLIFVIDEGSLRREVGGVKVMVRQLERLREFATQDHVTLQILPFTVGAHRGMFGNFILLEFADSLADLVHLETMNEITLRDDADAYAHYLERFVQLEGKSLSPEDSDAMLVKLIDEMSSTTSTSAETAVR